MREPAEPGWYLVRRGAIGAWDKVEVVSYRGRLAVSMPGWFGPMELPCAIYDGADWRGPFYPDSVPELARLRAAGDELAKTAREALVHIAKPADLDITDLTDDIDDRLRTALTAWSDARKSDGEIPSSA